MSSRSRPVYCRPRVLSGVLLCTLAMLILQPWRLSAADETLQIQIPRSPRNHRRMREKFMCKRATNSFTSFHHRTCKTH